MTDRWSEIFHGSEDEIFAVGYPTIESALYGEREEARSEEPGSFVVLRKHSKQVIRLMEEARR